MSNVVLQNGFPAAQTAVPVLEGRIKLVNQGLLLLPLAHRESAKAQFKNSLRIKYCAAGIGGEAAPC